MKKYKKGDFVWIKAKIVRTCTDHPGNYITDQMYAFCHKPEHIKLRLSNSSELRKR
jgi:hypothetical protein